MEPDNVQSSVPLLHPASSGGNEHPKAHPEIHSSASTPQTHDLTAPSEIEHSTALPESPYINASPELPQPAAPPDQYTSTTSQGVSGPTSGFSLWAKNLKIPQPTIGQDSSAGTSAFTRLTSGLGLRLSPKGTQQDTTVDGSGAAGQAGVFGALAKGIADTSKNAVKAVQVKARHMVSMNKRRYQDGGFDLDMTYITENIIAMGFPAGDLSSGLFGYFEGFYRNHMEEVIRFFETNHKGKYKVYNLCSERLYDASLLEGKVACFPFNDHNCPPLHLITSFCRSAYSWLKEDIENVVVVHCKAGMARTGLMISSLLLYLKFFPTAEESMDYYNQKRCIDGKGLVLPSQIRYVKYFERVLTYFNGESPPGRRCMLRGFRLHRCPYWIRPSITISNHNGVLFSTKKHPRTKDLQPEDFWFTAPKRGIMVFALPGEPGLTELAGDFKVHFHDRQGDFYCWLNTTMMENRTTLNTADLDDFDKRKLPSPGFQLEVVLVDYDGSEPKPAAPSAADRSESAPTSSAGPTENHEPVSSIKEAESPDKDDVFSDNESEESVRRRNKALPSEGGQTGAVKPFEDVTVQKEVSSMARGIEKVTVKDEVPKNAPDATNPAEPGSNISSSPKLPSPVESSSESEIKAIAADASVFSFGDEDDYESE